MRPFTLTQTGSGAGVTNSDPVRMNWRDPGATLSLVTDGSTTGFTVQTTPTPPDGYASASAWGAAADWFDTTDMTAVTANVQKATVSPVQGIRIQANASGTDTATVYVTPRED